MTVLGYDYPLLGLFWTMMWWFLWIAWIVLLFKVIADIFRSRDMGGFAKALWAIFVIVVPWLGVLVYLIARGDAMSERDSEQARAQESAFRSYVQDAAGSGGGGTADELTKLAALKAQGVLSEAEFAQQKAKLLA
jgi:Short C-terminal domain/Phospholipase_D-nuclease N-terminal